MKVGVVGLGYVGLPLISAFCKKGIPCIGFDIDDKRVQLISDSKSFLDEPSDSDLKSFKKKNLLDVTTDFSRIKEVDHIAICVPTPIDTHRKPNLDYVINSVKSITDFLQKDTLISLESTTYPGTTREILKPLIEDKGHQIGSDIFLAFSPEREDPGNKNFNLSNTPKVVSGLTEYCAKKAKNFYSKICDQIVMVSSLEVAETTKLLENIQRSVNIGLMNEMKIFAEKMDINLFEVIDAAATKPFGFSKYYPGPGVGGHCIPVDPFYLTYKAKEFNLDTKFIELAGEINRSMPNFIFKNISNVLNSMNLAISGSKILCLGLSYKKNVADTRESPPIEIFNLLKINGCDADFSDPHLDYFPPTKRYDYNDQSIDINKKNLSKYNLVVLLTDHDAFDYNFILNNSSIIIDTRGRYHSMGIKSKKVIIS
ncbi:MAG: UDP-N-acetyl-D-glucosamine dehydrogenase [Candidatus Marinimicrobia bacterium]|nr:UDP-N-acetyl-D-glucosamine dehydrogenase [Candidatus Neomarinimicrobiota bacterium]|tara:strand:+ start:860 stop:2137 length:1278 start_codon:yes stop_codon:yes gene_type:complete